MIEPGWSLSFSASCPAVVDQGFACMVCGADATGHATVKGGAHDGRCLAILCPLHASEDGYVEFRSRLINWGSCGLLELDGGPGPDGAPEVWHRDHLDPLPTSNHGDAW